MPHQKAILCQGIAVMHGYYYNTCRERDIRTIVDITSVSSSSSVVNTMQGPNFLWHIDGNDKLITYGFAIHGCIDG